MHTFSSLLLIHSMPLLLPLMRILQIYSAINRIFSCNHPAAVSVLIKILEFWQKV